MNSTLGVLFNVLAYVLGATVFILEARRRRYVMQQVVEIALIGLLSGVAFSAVVQALVTVEVDSRSWVDALGGRTIIGGVLGGWLAVVLSRRRFGIRDSTGPLWALALPAGEAIGRVGCYFHGCCYGRESELPWALYSHDALRHPTQLYMALASLFVFAVVFRLRDRLAPFPLYLLLWSLSRLAIEPLREAPSNEGWLAILACAVIALVACFILIRQWITNNLPTRLAIHRE